MERVIADAKIAVGDPRRRAAPQNLDNHLTWLVRRCSAAGVPLILCTLPCNERDLHPIGDDLPPAPGTRDRAEFDRLVDEIDASKDPVTSAALLEGALRIHDAWARGHFLLARTYEALGQPLKAAAEYERARDLDTMPWRPLTACNDAVHHAARNGAVLCDLESGFREASQGSVIGWELMDDHVHASLRGQALIATSILASMEDLPETVRISTEAREKLPDWTVYATRLGDNMFDRYGAARRMVRLFEAPFYRANNEEALRRFETICADFESQMTSAELEAARAWQDPYVHKGGHRPLTGMVGRARMDEGDFTGAYELLTIARRAVPRYSIWNLELGWHALACGQHLADRPGDADRALAEEIVANGTIFLDVTGVSPPLVHRYVGLACHFLGRYGDAIRHLGEAVRFVHDSSGFDVVRALVESLVATDQIDRALKLLSMPVRDPALRRECLDLLQALEESRLAP
jgi:tetratricopeptide (TPR) repeat protein